MRTLTNLSIAYLTDLYIIDILDLARMSSTGIIRFLLYIIIIFEYILVLVLFWNIIKDVFNKMKESYRILMLFNSLSLECYISFTIRCITPMIISISITRIIMEYISQKNILIIVCLITIMQIIFTSIIFIKLIVPMIVNKIYSFFSCNFTKN